MNIFIWAQNPNRFENDFLIDNGRLLSSQDLERTSIVKQMYMIQDKGKEIFNEDDNILVMREGTNYLIHFQTLSRDEYNRKTWASIWLQYEKTSDTFSVETMMELIKRSLSIVGMSNEFPRIERAINKVINDIFATQENMHLIGFMVSILMLVLICVIIAIIVLPK